MQSKKQKFIYWLLGLGSGMIISGILMTAIGLRVVEQTRQAVNQTKQSIGIQQESVGKNMPIQEEDMSTGEENIQEQNIQKENIQEQTVGIEQEKQESVIEESYEIKEEVLLEETLQEQRIQEDMSSEVSDESNQIKRNIYIPLAATATSIARQLANEEIIDDSDAFISYIRDQEKLNLLRSGYFLFPETATYEEALNILLRK